MKESPSTRGIRSLTWAMTMRAQSAAALGGERLHAEAHEAVLVGGRDLDDGDIERE